MRRKTFDSHVSTVPHTQLSLRSYPGTCFFAVDVRSASVVLENCGLVRHPVPDESCSTVTASDCGNALWYDDTADCDGTCNDDGTDFSCCTSEWSPAHVGVRTVRVGAGVGTPSSPEIESQGLKNWVRPKKNDRGASADITLLFVGRSCFRPGCLVLAELPSSNV